MEVQLRKTKITKSIVDQTLLGEYALFYNYKEYDILGWCLLKLNKRDRRFIILYHREKQTLRRLPYAKNVQIEGKSIQEPKGTNDWHFPWYEFVSIYFPDFSQQYEIFKSREKEKSEEIANTIKEFLETVEQKGQIYL